MSPGKRGRDVEVWICPFCDRETNRYGEGDTRECVDCMPLWTPDELSGRHEIVWRHKGREWKDWAWQPIPKGTLMVKERE